MNCPNCENEIKENQKFCPKCGKELKENQKFCANCGNYAVERDCDKKLYKIMLIFSFIALLISLAVLPTFWFMF